MFIKIFLKYYCVSVERRLFTATRMNILNSISPGECCRVAELLGVICCWIVARLEHLPSWCDHGTWGNEQRWTEHKTGSRSQHSTVITCTSTQGGVTMDTSKDSFANTELANPANLARLLRLPLPCTDRDGGYTGQLFRSRIFFFIQTFCRICTFLRIMYYSCTKKTYFWLITGNIGYWCQSQSWDDS